MSAVWNFPRAREQGEIKMKLGCHYEKYLKKVKKVSDYEEMIEDIEEAFGDKHET